MAANVSVCWRGCSKTVISCSWLMCSRGRWLSLFKSSAVTLTMLFYCCQVSDYLKFFESKRALYVDELSAVAEDFVSSRWGGGLVLHVRQLLGNVCRSHTYTHVLLACATTTTLNLPECMKICIPRMMSTS